MSLRMRNPSRNGWRYTEGQEDKNIALRNIGLFLYACFISFLLMIMSIEMTFLFVI